jgi:hypothetical protein
MLTRKLTTTIATASLLASMFVPAAFAETTIDISGNGTQSHNTVNLTNGNTTIVDQTTSTNATTNITANANTGNNTANANTGGDVSIDTGMASNDVTVVVTGGDNVADLPTPCGCQTAADVVIAGNGSNTKNKVNLSGSNLTVVGQNAITKAKTTVKVTAKTGNNKANKNTGGTTGITTNDASNTAGVAVSGGSNLLGSLLGVLGL